MEPIDPDDDARLDALLSDARWPQPSTASTQRLQATWARISPASRPRRLRRFVVAVAAAVIIGFGLAIPIVHREPADQTPTQFVKAGVPPQTSQAPSAIAATQGAAVAARGVIATADIASIAGRDMSASDKLAVWSALRRPIPAARHRQVAVVATAMARASTRQVSRRPVRMPPPTADVGVDDEAKVAANLVAIRIRLARN